MFAAGGAEAGQMGQTAGGAMAFPHSARPPDCCVPCSVCPGLASTAWQVIQSGLELTPYADDLSDSQRNI